MTRAPVQSGTRVGRRGPLRLLLVDLCVVATGCALVTNLGTSGYEPFPSSACSSTSGDTACSSTGPTCMSPGECSGGEICCLTTTIAPTFNFACQAGPSCSGVMGAQLCGDAGDCDGGACITQTCQIDGSPTLLHTCGMGVGLSPFCDSGS